MTLLARNNCFKGGIFLATLSLALVITGGYLAFPAFPDAAASAAARSRGIIQRITEEIAGSSPYIPYWTMLGAAAYAFISIILIYLFFEKTQSPEILFIGFFVISMTFELARLVVPLKSVLPLPATYLSAASRILLFGRYFGLFSLFAASVYAAGLNAQKQQNIIFMVVLASMIIPINVPIDSLVWDSTLMLRRGYGTLLLLVELAIMAITILTFIISAYTRGSRRYIFIGIGILLIFAGKNILLYSNTWITLVPGLIILAAGTWLVCSLLHLEYLWH